MIERTDKGGSDTLPSTRPAPHMAVTDYASILENAPFGFILADASGSILEANGAYCRMSGYDRQELPLLTLDQIDAGTSEVPPAWRAAVPGGSAVQLRQRRKDGSVYLAEINVQRLPESGYLALLIWDITERKGTEDQLRLTHYSIDAVADMIVWLDEDARYIFVNDAAVNLLGYSRKELLTKRVYDIDPEFSAERWKAHWAEIEERGSFTIETVNRSKQGVDIPIEVTVNFVYFEGRKFNCSIVRDITTRKRAAAEMAEINRRMVQLSITDDLTGLANRRHFNEVLAAEYARHLKSGDALSLILLDVDAFKAFNDHHGHQRGDECLRRLADVLKQNMRCTGDLAARYGGEEFACILPCTGWSGAQAIAERILNDVRALGILHGTSPVAGTVTASLGVLSTRCTHHEHAEALVAAVDNLLYEAKRTGRNRIVHGGSP